MLFVVPSGVSSSTYLPGYDVTLTSYKQFLYRLVTELDRSELLDSTAGTSYAQWHIDLFSGDDRFFVRHDWGQFEASGYHDVKEYTADGQFQRPVQPPVRNFRIHKPASDGCSAVVGDWYYYRSARTFDILRGDVGGDFYRYNVATGQEELLQNVRSTQNCFFNLMSSGGALYDVRTDTTGAAFSLYRRDLVTGAATELANFSEQNPAAYDTTYRFAMEQGIFYIARRRKSDAQIEIYTYDLNQTTPVLEQLYADAPAPMEILVNLDVDDGHVMLASSNGHVLMLDIAARTQQMLNLGVGIGSIAQVLVK